MAKTHPPGGKPHADPQDKERLAADALAAGQFRKARDLYKDLCKADRARFLGGLVESNRKLALQMIEKGQCSEAEQVRTYLKTIAPPEVLHELDLELALKGHTWPEALRSAVALWCSSSHSIRNQQKVPIADAIVLAAPSAEQMAAFPDPLGQEAGAILGGFEDLSASRFDALAAKLRPLGTGSIFAPWKTFLKGLAAFHMGMRDKARTLFAMLPERSAATRAANGYAFFLSGEKALQDASSQAQSQMLHGSLRLIGQSSCATALDRAEALWKAGKHRDAYKALRALPTFPTLEDGMARALSDLFFKGSFMGDSARESFFMHLDDLLFQGPLKSDLEGSCAAIALLSAAIKGRRHMPPHLYLETLGELYKAPCPTRAELLSFGYQQLTDAVLRDREIAEEEHQEAGFLKHLGECALDYLERSIGYTPDDWDANFARVLLMRKISDFNSVATAAELLCQRFEHEKKAFLLAGEIHSEASPPDHLLASNYFNRARSLDQHDPEVNRRLADSLLASGAAFYLSGEPPMGRLQFEQFKLDVPDRSSDVSCSHEYARVRQGVLETLCGDRKKGAALIEQSLSSSPCLPLIWLLQHACLRIWSKKAKRENELLQKISAHPLHSPSERSRLLDLLLHIRGWRIKGSQVTWRDEETAVALALGPLAAGDFSESEAASVLTVALDHCMMTQLARDIAKTGTKLLPGRVFFKAVKYGLSNTDTSVLQMNKLEKLEEKARESGDKEALRFIKAELKRLAASLVFDEAWEKWPPNRRKPRQRKKTASTAASERAPKSAPKRKSRKIEMTESAPETQPAPPPLQLDLL